MNHSTSEPSEGAQPYRWNIALVEDHLLQRKRTEELVAAQPALRMVWSGETLPEFMQWLADGRGENLPHLLLLDLMVERGPSVSTEAVESVIHAGIRVLVISALASPVLIRRVIRVGVSGVVGKRDTEADIVAAIWTTLGNGHWMTPELASAMASDENRPALSDQEERVLLLYASGLTLDSVAKAMDIKTDTAKKYLARIKVKYAAAGRPVRTKLDLNEAARQDGVLEP